MAKPKLNKKVLCLLDEYGTAGNGDLFLGAVILHARDAGRIDKYLSDLLEPSASEIHASDLDDGYVQGLLQRFWSVVPRQSVVLVNRKVSDRGGEAPVFYAHAVVETVKAGLLRFQRDVLKSQRIGNVELIMDANHHNRHAAFDAAVELARREDGRFRGVTSVVCLDSAASRLLQLADVVAYSRKWILNEEINAAGLRERFGVQLP